MNDMDKFKDGMTQALFGRSLQISQAGGQCVICGEFNLEFRDERSRKEYGISGMCQCCQDMTFGEEE